MEASAEAEGKQGVFTVFWRGLRGGLDEDHREIGEVWVAAFSFEGVKIPLSMLPRSSTTRPLRVHDDLRPKEVDDYNSRF
jgi:hypothetical protein